MKRFVQLFLLVCAMISGFETTAVSQSQVPAVVALDDSVPILGSVLLDPSNHPVTFPANSFFDVFTELSLDFSGSSRAPAPGTPHTFVWNGMADLRGSNPTGQAGMFRNNELELVVNINPRSPVGDEQTFDTEMLSLSISGGSLPAGVRVRESPTLASRGWCFRVRASDGSGRYMTSSFFDVFLELSVDGGGTWIPADGSVRLEAKIPPKLTTYSPPGPVPAGIAIGDLDSDGLPDLVVTNRTAPPSPPVGGSSTSSLDCDVRYRYDGLDRLVRTPTCVVRSTHTYDDGSTQHFDTEMLQLDLSGGTLPGGVMVRESPTKASLGRTSLRSIPENSLFEVSSFFDIFTELSIDGGQSWTPQPPASLEFRDTLPHPRESPSLCVPAATYPDDLYPPAGALMSVNPGPPVTYSNGMRTGNIHLSPFRARSSLPALGVTQEYGGDQDCDMQISPGSGQPFQDVHAAAHSTVRVTHTSDDGTTRTFDTEMLSLDISGGTLPPGMMIRESPTKQSLGKHTVTPNGGGYKIDSFFDIFTELSLDGGGTWSPSAESTRVEQVLFPPAHMFSTTNFPPPGVYQMTPACSEVMFANGADMRVGSFFDIFPEVALPPPGGSSINPFHCRSRQSLSLDGGLSFFDVFFDVTGSVRCDATNTTPTEQFFDTEMLALALSGGGGGSGGSVMIRESPTLPSLGRATMHGSPPDISSFFDVFFELSVDGGQTWSPARSPMRIELDSLRNGSISGMKWHDENGNGVKDAVESNLSNWKIVLCDTLGNVLDTVRTDAAGNYSFPSVPPGTYRVKEEPQPGWVQTGGSPAYGFVIVSGDSLAGLDFGNFAAPNLYGYKFNDHNGNGVRDPEDEGLEGWEICIFPKNNPNSDLGTNNGTATFSMQLGLPPGEPVTGTLRGFNVTKRNAITATQQNESAAMRASHFENGDIPTEMLALDLQGRGQNASSFFDITYRESPTKRKGWDGTIKGNLRESPTLGMVRSSFFDVFFDIAIDESGVHRSLHAQILLEADLDGDGVPDPIRPGVVYTGGPVVLYDDQGAPAGTLDSFTYTVGDLASPSNPICVKTDKTGKYCFMPMPPGTWNVIEHPQPCWDQTTPNPPPITVVSGTTLPQIDFGNHEREGTICVAKFDDINHNQLRDPGEPPMPNVGFVLTDLATNQAQNQVTDAAGVLYFSNLPPGDYRLTEIMPPGYTVSRPKTGEEFFPMRDCETTKVEWLNAAALTDSTFRTATYEEWATTVDIKNARKPIKCKPDKVEFKVNLVVPPPSTGNNFYASLVLKFSMPVDSLRLWAGKQKTVPYCYKSATPDPKRTTWTLDLLCEDITHPPYPPTPGDTIQIEGHGLKGKPITVAYLWTNAAGLLPGKLPSKPLIHPNGDTLKQWLRLPMPNLVNVLDELADQGVFPIVVGGAVGDTHSVYLKNVGDLLKSLAKPVRNGPFILHDSTTLGECFDSLGGKLVKKQIKGISPDKIKHRLFAEALTLKLNILASRYGKFPPGFDTLIYDYHKFQPGPFDGKHISEIMKQIEIFLSCKGNPKPLASPLDYYFVLRRINGAFSGPMDSIRWSCLKLQLKGVRTLKDVPFLRAEPGAVAQFVDAPFEQSSVNRTPATYQLLQNYPNPFNPTTTIQFELAEPAEVTLKVYNALGQEMATLLDREWMEDGTQDVEFNANTLPSGVYFYRIIAQGLGDEEEGIAGQRYVSVKKMLLIK